MSGIISIGGFRERLTGSVGDAPVLTDAGTKMSSSFADIRCIAMQTGVLVHLHGGVGWRLLLLLCQLLNILCISNLIS